MQVSMFSQLDDILRAGCTFQISSSRVFLHLHQRFNPPKSFQLFDSHISVANLPFNVISIALPLGSPRTRRLHFLLVLHKLDKRALVDNRVTVTSFAVKNHQIHQNRLAMTSKIDLPVTSAKLGSSVQLA